MNLKYYGEWNDFPNNNRMRLEFYVPAVSVVEQLTIRECKETRPTLSPFGDQTLFGTTLDITIVSPSRLYYKNSFYLANMKGMLVKLFVNYGQAGQRIAFIGYVNSEMYEDSFGGTKNYDLFLTANNGISLLDRMLLLKDDDSIYTGVLLNFDLIKRSLAQLEISYNSIFIASLATVYTVEANETIFHKVFSKAENFYDETNTPMSLKDVLGGLLFSHFCKLYIIDNSIYIVDVSLLNEEQITAKQYNFETLSYVGTSVIKSNHVALDELGTGHSLYMTPAKNKIDIVFNKYVYSSEEQIGATADNVQTPIGKEAFYDSQEVFQYYEQKYFSSANVDVLTNQHERPQFVVKTDVEGEATESYIRLFTGIGDGFHVRLKSKRLLLASDMFVGIKGSVQFEDLTSIGQEKNFPVWVTHHALPFYFRPVMIPQEGMEGMDEWSFEMDGVSEIPVTPINIYRNYMDQSYGSDWSERKWRSGISPIPVATWWPGWWEGFGGEWKKYNEWYPINGGVLYSMGRIVEDQNGAKSNLDKYGIVIPLANFYANTQNAPQGGQFALDIYMPNTTQLPGIKTLLLKDMSISILKEMDFNIFKAVDDSDTVSQIIGDVQHKDSMSIETTQGTDELGLARGTYVLKTDGAFNDIPATNERFVNLNKVAYIYEDGVASSVFNAIGANDDVYVTQVLEDGKIAIGGAFTSYNGVSVVGRVRMLILNTDGTVSSWRPPYRPSGAGQIVTTIAEQLAVQTLYHVGTQEGYLHRINKISAFVEKTILFNNRINVVVMENIFLFVGGAFTSYVDGNGVSIAAGAFSRVRVSDYFSSSSGCGHFIFMGNVNPELPAEVYTIAADDGESLIFIGGLFNKYIEPSADKEYSVQGMIGINWLGQPLNPYIYHQGDNWQVTTKPIPTDYTPRSFSGDPQSNVIQIMYGRVYSIILTPGLNLYIVGDFRGYGDVSSINMISLNAITGVVTLPAKLPFVGRKIKETPNGTLFIVGENWESRSDIMAEYTHQFEKLPFSGAAGFATNTYLYDFVNIGDHTLLGGNITTYHGFSFNNSMAVDNLAIPQGYGGAIGSMEYICLNLYHRQLKQPRYVFTNVEIREYPKPFQSFTYALLQREANTSIFVINKMEIDYVRKVVSADLEEII